MMTSQYTKISEDTLADSEGERQHEWGNTENRPSSWRHRISKAAVLVALLLTLNSILLVLIYVSVSSSCDGNAHSDGPRGPRWTEWRKFSFAVSSFPPILLVWLANRSSEAFPAIGEEIVQYTGGLHFTAPEKMYMTNTEGLPRYVGEPSEEIDNNWELLLGGMQDGRHLTYSKI
jgi:hypothetical protein